MRPFFISIEKGLTLTDFDHCASSCKEGGHRSYGECLRSKNLAATGLESTSPSFATKRVKAFDKELDLYESAVKQGIQPDSTQTPAIRKALDASDKHGKPYRADV